MTQQIGIAGVHRTEVRLTPAGFAWVFHGKNVETGKPVELTIRFDFCWFRHLARDLRALLDQRDEETQVARSELTKTS